jgi:hypothetical protein
LRIADNRELRVCGVDVETQFRMLHPLRHPGLTSDHGNGVWRRRADHGVKEVIEKREAIRIVPEKWSGVAIHMADH